jgi:hypothetical protein
MNFWLAGQGATGSMKSAIRTTRYLAANIENPACLGLDVAVHLGQVWWR